MNKSNLRKMLQEIVTIATVVEQVSTVIRRNLPQAVDSADLAKVLWAVDQSLAKQFGIELIELADRGADAGEQLLASSRELQHLLSRREP